MLIRELRLREFRNFEEVSFHPGNSLNILVGANARGKSNLLEAIYLLATTRSLRAMRESEMVQHGADSAGVWAEVEREKEADVELDATIFSSDKKSVRINGVKRARVLDLLGQLNVVYFGALDLAIVSGDPSIRRRYLNIEISQISPKYVFEFGSYKKSLDQRNRLLKELRERPRRDSGLEAWNEQLVQHGAPLFQKRRFFIDRLAPLADEIHRGLTDGRESLAVRYLPSVTLPPDDAAIANSFRSELERQSPEEQRRGVTLTGPQRDDIQFSVDGRDARSFASMGQQRTVVLSVKLAQFKLMEEYVGEPPILLLDDVMSDLDDARRSHLLKWIDRRCQTFISCTNLRAFPPEVSGSASIFEVSAGRLSAQESDGAGAPEAPIANGHTPAPAKASSRTRETRKEKSA